MILIFVGHKYYFLTMTAAIGEKIAFNLCKMLMSYLAGKPYAISSPALSLTPKMKYVFFFFQPVAHLFKTAVHVSFSWLHNDVW